MSNSPESAPSVAGLRRDLGTLESYAALLGILIGAGIFKVTGDAWRLTGPSVVLGYVVFAPIVLATSVAYCVFLSTPLGLEPGGEYGHISRTFGGHRIAFLGAWLKIISYIGALAYLARALADYVGELTGAGGMGTAVTGLLVFYAAHVAGVRWFGRLQVAMCVVLGLSILVLVVPGLFAIRVENYRPFFTHGLTRFMASLPPLFFAYAGFEALAQTAGEVRDSRRKLPRVFLLGITATMVIFTLMSAVALGVLPPERLRVSSAPMAEAASLYLPIGAAHFVAIGAIMAVATSLNATMLVPSRVAIMLAGDGLAPRWLARVSAVTGTPVLGLTITAGLALALLLSGQISLALNIAVFALVVLYLLHSVALLLLPRLNPELFQSATTRIPLAIQRIAAAVSIISMTGLIVLQIVHDAGVLRQQSLRERIANSSLTTLELILFWTAIGALFYALEAKRRR